MKAFLVAGLLLLTGCATVPTRPSVMVLPGDRKSFEQFQVDNAACRDWASQEIGVPGEEAARRSTVSGAAIGTAIG
ncbi:MAG TPA: glycine zipper family protein, partial [Candidatus Tectomicrobia bacterium]|nr:glycine zipper family protein [Candidatus Tectomicrobia bacterium]